MMSMVRRLQAANAQLAQKNFTSWQEFSDNFLDGREIWAGGRAPRFDAFAKLFLNPADPNSLPLTFAGGLVVGQGQPVSLEEPGQGQAAQAHALLGQEMPTAEVRARLERMCHDSDSAVSDSTRSIDIEERV